MSRSKVYTVFAASVWFATATFAQAPAGAPAGSTGQCKDGTYYSGATKKGACRGHKGVKDWYAAAAAESAAPAAASPVMKAVPAAVTPSVMPAPAPMAAAAPKSTYTPPAVAAPGGGAGQVWVNKKSKVYHCSTDRWYGKTKDGAYMSEADAKAQGFRADHGKVCQ